MACVENKAKAIEVFLWLTKKKSDALKSLLRNPLSPDIDMYILVTVPHMFPILLIERICSNIKTFHLW